MAAGACAAELETLCKHASGVRSITETFHAMAP